MDKSTSLVFHGVLLGSVLGVVLGAGVGFGGGFILSHSGGGMWILFAMFMGIACGLIELVLGAITGAYISAQDMAKK